MLNIEVLRLFGLSNYLNGKIQNAAATATTTNHFLIIFTPTFTSLIKRSDISFEVKPNDFSCLFQTCISQCERMRVDVSVNSGSGIWEFRICAEKWHEVKPGAGYYSSDWLQKLTPRCAANDSQGKILHINEVAYFACLLALPKLNHYLIKYCCNQSLRLDFPKVHHVLTI